MDTFKAALNAHSPSESSSIADHAVGDRAAANSALIDAFGLIGAFSSALLSLTERESIRALVVATVKRMLGVETAEVIYFPSENSELTIRRVFETAESR